MYGVEKTLIYPKIVVSVFASIKERCVCVLAQ